MSRHAKAGVTRVQLMTKIDNAGGVYEAVWQSKVQDDLKKVEFDCENMTDPNDEEGFNMPGFKHGYDTLPNGVEVCWVGAGGDWEDPLAFCFYIGEDSSLRAYIPKDGNAYNFATNAAIGNWFPGEDDDKGWEAFTSAGAEDGCSGPHLPELKHFGLKYQFDMDKLRADASAQITSGQ